MRLPHGITSVIELNATNLCCVQLYYTRYTMRLPHGITSVIELNATKVCSLLIRMSIDVVLLVPGKIQMVEEEVWNALKNVIIILTGDRVLFLMSLIWWMINQGAGPGAFLVVG